MAITINGSGTITGVSAGGLPDGSITADDLASTLDISGKTVTLPSDVGGITTGKILQLVNTTKTTAYSTTSTTFGDVTGLSATITPTSTSNKILVMVNGFISNDASNNYCYLRILRGTTEIDENVQVEGDTFSYAGKNFLNVIYDSPATTSATTYKVQIRAEVSGNAARINGGADAGSTDHIPNTNITLMEIAG